MVKAALEPAGAARFAAHAYGFRPGRCTLDALAAIHVTLSPKPSSAWVLDADISGGFDPIAQGPWWATVPVCTATLRRWLHAGVVARGGGSPTDTGTPQGGGLTLPTTLPTCW
jgi:RNA-directed DNA polymerase